MYKKGHPLTKKEPTHADVYQAIRSLQRRQRQFFKAMMDVAVKKSYDTGQVLFDLGDPADHFYILVKGAIELTMSSDEKKIYTGDQTGESFGWSSLLERGRYTASARAKIPTVVLQFDKNGLQQIIDDDPTSGIIFYKYLAKTLCRRLLKSYEILGGRDTAQ